MKLETMLVLDENVRGNEARVTLVGQRLYDIGTPIPLIVKGEKCIGIATVQQFLVMKDSTRVEFTINTNIRDETKKALFTLYQQNKMMLDDEDDPYETDAFIPGAMGLRTPKPGKRW